MSDSSVYATPATSKTQKLTTMKNKQRQESKESERSKSKHKIDKVKPLHKTPSGRDPMQKKLLTKEDFESYDKENLLDVMSDQTEPLSSEQMVKETQSEPQITDCTNDKSITNKQDIDPSHTLVLDLDNTKMGARHSHSSTDVNLSQKTTETIQDGGEQKQNDKPREDTVNMDMRLPAFLSREKIEELENEPTPQKDVIVLHPKTENTKDIPAGGSSKKKKRNSRKRFAEHSRALPRAGIDVDMGSSNKISRASTATQTRKKAQKLGELFRKDDASESVKTKNRTIVVQDTNRKDTKTKNASHADHSTTVKSNKIPNNGHQVIIKETKSVTRIKETTVKEINSKTTIRKTQLPEVQQNKTHAELKEASQKTCQKCKKMINYKLNVDRSHCAKCGKTMHRRFKTLEAHGKVIVMDPDDKVTRAVQGKESLTIEDVTLETTTEAGNENESKETDDSVDEKTAEPDRTETDIPISTLILTPSKSYALVTKLNLQEEETKSNDDTGEKKPTDEKDNKDNQSSFYIVPTNEIEATVVETSDHSKYTEVSAIGMKRLFNEDSNSGIENKMPDNSNEQNEMLENQNEILEAQRCENVSEADMASRADMKDMQSMMEDLDKGEDQMKDRVDTQETEDSTLALQKVYKNMDRPSSGTSFIQDLKQRTRDLVNIDFPLKIQTINALLTKEKNKLAQIVQSTNLLTNNSCSFINFPHAANFPNSIKVNSIKHSNYLERKHLTVDENLVQLITKVKTFVQTLMQDINTLKLWICLILSTDSTSTRINNDTLVEELIHEVETAEREANTMQDDILAYYVKRNNVISEIFKYPHITHSEHILEAINYKQYIDLQIILSVLRNKYSILHSLLTAHWKQYLMQE
ncbi:hypothetical protein M8J75_000112 [Diaphorina citri]|nr:hypothetical protein M8J75_000112 [Diaphorina citri]